MLAFLIIYLILLVILLYMGEFLFLSTMILYILQSEFISNLRLELYAFTCFYNSNKMTVT